MTADLSRRECLRAPQRQRGYFDYFDLARVLDFAIQALGEWGETLDIPLLRTWSSHKEHDHAAIRAIKKLEYPVQLAPTG